ncbi:hypothetical protein GS982_01455 [Rhodococcus hoagii]|uniref:Uncharacterized protein n=1 Tax=Rhodococcus hoagii TaxID=43767 RepID=A0A9Q5EW47_RHOHA|nr:hypothetical protein [Prescottella equi]NKT77265.1 hypothetical protein [Prescottella equi]NKZ81050.1 hypothetical protein [Prescottella equi]
MTITTTTTDTTTTTVALEVAWTDNTAIVTGPNGKRVGTLLQAESVVFVSPCKRGAMPVTVDSVDAAIAHLTELTTKSRGKGGNGGSTVTPKSALAAIEKAARRVAGGKRDVNTWRKRSEVTERAITSSNDRHEKNVTALAAGSTVIRADRTELSAIVVKHHGGVARQFDDTIEALESRVERFETELNALVTKHVDAGLVTADEATATIAAAIAKILK